ncbi:MAG: NUDIX hydrolase [Thermomicrobiales bacterium]
MDARPNTTTIDATTSMQPAIDVRTVLFTVADGTLLIALETRHDDRRLPQGIPWPSESIDAAAKRIVRDTTGVHEQYLEQLYTLSVRDEQRWKVIISYVALIASHQAPTLTDGAVWCDVLSLPTLSTADRLVVEYALVRLRAKLGYTNVAFHLLPETFTLTELQSAYETILGRPLDKRNFRRRVIASGILKSTPDKRRDGSHRPAALYRFHAEHDPATYLTPTWAGDA